MSETSHQDLNGVSETLLIPLCYRAIETQRPDAMIKDETAVALLERLSSAGPIRYDSHWLKQTPMAKMNRVLRMMLTREMDRYARDFLSRHPEAVVVHIGCGFDTRFNRVDNGLVEWYDLDLPEVIELRRELLGAEAEFSGGRYHHLSASVLEEAWMDASSAHRRRPFLFLAEGVFMYFEAAQVKALVLALRDHFPGAELVFDGWKPFQIWIGRLVLGDLLRWGFWRAQELEGWGDPSTALRTGGIRLLDEWGYFDRPEPRLRPFRWMAPVFRLLKPMRVFHFRLGEAAG